MKQMMKKFVDAKGAERIVAALMGEKMSEFIMKRKDNYWWEVTLVKLGKPFIIFLTHTSVTPNMITLINLIIMLPLICLMAWENLFCTRFDGSDLYVFRYS